MSIFILEGFSKIFFNYYNKKLQKKIKLHLDIKIVISFFIEKIKKISNKVRFPIFRICFGLSRKFANHEIYSNQCKIKLKNFGQMCRLKKKLKTHFYL